jgi:hypothetical protein
MADGLETWRSERERLAERINRHEVSITKLKTEWLRETVSSETSGNFDNDGSAMFLKMTETKSPIDRWRIKLAGLSVNCHRRGESSFNNYWLK